MRRMKILSFLAAGLILIGAISLLLFKMRADSHYYDGYDPAASLNAELRLDEARDEYRWVDFAFDGVRGLRVPAVMAMPLAASEPVPCVIFLHGIGQSKGFLTEIATPFVDAGFAMVSFDQYTRGERRENTPWYREPLQIRRRAALTVLETRRLIDYLESRQDIASDRIYLVGASYGAITGATAVAQDTRVKAAIMVYGGGNLPILMASDAVTQGFAQNHLSFIMNPAIAAAAWLMAPGDPIKHVGRVAPRPLLFQNGTADSLIPADAAKAFFSAAKEPKEQRWYEGDHIGLDEATVRTVLDEALMWIQDRDAETSNLAHETAGTAEKEAA
jgi:uncharacterized protein